MADRNGVFMSNKQHMDHSSDAFNKGTAGETAKWQISNKNFTEGEKVQVYSVRLPNFSSGVTFSTNGELTSNGTISVSEVVVEIRNNSSSVLSLYGLTQGQPLDTITIERLANIGKTMVVLQTFTFNTCYLTKWAQEDDSVWISFSFEKISNTRITYGHDGNKIGNTATTYNVSTLESTQSAG